MITWVRFSNDNVMVGRDNAATHTYHPTPARGNRLLRALLADCRYAVSVRRTQRGLCKTVLFYERLPRKTW